MPYTAAAMTTAPSTAISSIRRRVSRWGGDFEAASIGGNSPPRSTSAPALAVAGLSGEPDSLIWLVVSVGMGYPLLTSRRDFRTEAQTLRLTYYCQRWITAVSGNTFPSPRGRQQTYDCAARQTCDIRDLRGGGFHSPPAKRRHRRLPRVRSTSRTPTSLKRPSTGLDPRDHALQQAPIPKAFASPARQRSARSNKIPPRGRG